MNSRALTSAMVTLAVGAIVGPAVPVGVRAEAPQNPVQPHAWANTLMLDHRAREVGDIVTVQITENIAATGSADANLDKSSTSDGALPWPLKSTWSKALQASADTKFNGGGTTSRTATVSAIMSARVTDRKPNGDLAIVGVREIVINGDRQLVTLSGIVRPADIANGNIVSSTAVGDLHIQYAGQGFVKDNLTPGWLVRFLNKVF